MSNEIVKSEKKLTASERFMNKVTAEFNSGVGEVALTNFQKRLAQNYFISIDATLKTTEIKRLAKKKNQDPLPVTWENVDLEKLSRNVVAAARIGLDPAQENHVHVIPYKNNALEKYNINLMPGYRGIELKAMKYGLDVPDKVIVELVYSTDTFKPIKKSFSNPYESYEFEITNPFKRGDIIGGFYYHIYANQPEKNKLVMMSIEDIEKRKPDYASAEFWGGEKPIWKDGKVVGQEKTDGWYEKMCYKTVHRAAYRDITIDSQKIDDDYLRLKQAEDSYTEAKIEDEIEENANKEVIDVEIAPVDEPDPDQAEENNSEGPDF